MTHHLVPLISHVFSFRDIRVHISVSRVVSTRNTAESASFAAHASASVFLMPSPPEVLQEDLASESFSTCIT